MNLVDDFDAYRFSLNGPESSDPDPSSARHAPATTSGFDMPLLSVDIAVKQTGRGRGDVVCVACANGNVLVATSRGYLIRYFWDEYGNERVTEAEVARSTDVHIVAVFMDPGANHVLVSTRGPGGAPELHYVHRRWSKSRPLAKLKGVAVTAVAWVWPVEEPEQAGGGGSTHSSRPGVGGMFGARPRGAGSGSDEPSAPPGASDSCTGAVLLGSDAGAVLELSLDEKLLAAKKEPAAKLLLQLPEPPQQPQQPQQPAAAPRPLIHSLRQELLPDGAGFLVLLATATHLYTFSGGPTLEALFGRYAGARPMAALEAVSHSTHSQLQLYYPSSVERAAAGPGPARERERGGPSRFAWLVGNIVYHGDVAMQGADAPGGCLRGTCSLPLPGAQQTAAQEAAAAAAAAASPPPPPNRSHSPGPGASPLSVAPSSPGGPAAGQLGQDDAQSLAMTAYHFIVLSGDQLYAVNRVSGRVVAEVGFRSPITKNVSGEPSRSIDGLVKDDVSGTIYVYSDESLYEVSVLQEGRDMWRVYLAQRDWELALRHCSSAPQRDEVHCSKAEAAMAAGDAATAALHFARVVGGRPSFEDIALRFVEAVQRERRGGGGGGGGGARPDGGGGGGGGDDALPDDALALFLSTKLTVLGRSDRAQATMVAAWLTELYLDQINRELLEAGGQHSPRYLAREQRLRLFLTTPPSLEALDPGTTCALLAGYGRLEELVAFAAARGDHEAVLEQLVSSGGGAAQALALMRRPSCGAELVYKFAPALVAAATEPVVDFFITAKPPLDPARLIPAMLRFGEPGSAPTGRRHVLRYVEFAVDHLDCRDAAVHNLAVALHSLADDEASLLAYLARAKDGLGRPLYDLRLALRLATERGKQRSCVRLLCGLDMFEDAVSLALGLDLELAKAVAAAPPEEDEAMRRRLWLAVAKHVVQRGAAGAAAAAAGPRPAADQQAANIKQAVEFLREADGLLKLEDILPFFPDFVTIDNFKDAICDSLERYNRKIEELRREMNEATLIADAVRRDLKLLSARTAALSAEQPCERCGRALGAPAAPCGLPAGGSVQPLIAFPTGLAYHGVCCAAEVMEVANPQQQARIRGLLSKLSKRPRPSRNEEQLQELQQQLLAEVAGEDPRNGEITVRMVDLPFVLENEQDQHAMWAI